MNVSYQTGEGRMEVFLRGSFDAVSAPKFEKEVCAKLDGISDLIFDLSGVDYISSAGLRVLLYVQQVLGDAGALHVRNPSDMVRTVIDVTGLREVIDVIGEDGK